MSAVDFGQINFDLLIVAVAFTSTVVALVLYCAIRAGFIIEENEMGI